MDILGLWPLASQIYTHTNAQSNTNHQPPGKNIILAKVIMSH